MLGKHDTEDQQHLNSTSSSAYATGGSSGNQPRQHSKCAFSVPELVRISGTLKDVCIGLAELAHPDTRAVDVVDVAYKPMWDHCFKVSDVIFTSLVIRFADILCAKCTYYYYH